MSKTIKLLALALVFPALSGCASLLYGPYEKISVSSTPDNALCKIYREGQGLVKWVASPDEIYIMRNEKPVTVTCSKAGYKTTSIVINTEQSQEAVRSGIGNKERDEPLANVHVNMPAE